MIITGLILAMSVALGALLWRIALRHGPSVATAEEWERKRLPVNVKAVSLLMDPDEEEYLKRRLSRDTFLQIQRQRAILARRCVQRVGDNAAMILQMAGRTALSPDPGLAAAARELTALASQVRTNAMLAQWKLWLRCLFPGIRIRVSLQPDSTQLIDRSVVLFCPRPGFPSKAQDAAV